jgi:acyl transferase domain-containing protein
MLGLNGHGDQLAETQYTQPILFALEIMLARVWARWGVQPNAVIGHSLGEFSAAAVAGVFSEKDGMLLVSERGKLMQKLAINGSYAVVIGESSEVIEIIYPLKPNVVVGGSNGPNITVVSGKENLVDEVLSECSRRGMTSRRINVSLPFHSPLMEPMLDEFDSYCTNFKFTSPQTPWFSTMTGQRLNNAEEVNSSYWRAQIVEPVRFWAGMVAVTDQRPSIMLEIGPGKTLLNMGKQAIPGEDHLWLSSLDPKFRDGEALKKAATILSEIGVPVNLAQVHEDCALLDQI